MIYGREGHLHAVQNDPGYILQRHGDLILILNDDELRILPAEPRWTAYVHAFPRHVRCSLSTDCSFPNRSTVYL